MKTKITLAMACFIGFVLCSAVAAYYPVLIVRACPHCRALVVQEDTLSGNTIGAKFYTDGKLEAKMLPDHPWLAKCPACSGLFWVDEAVEVDTGFDAAKGKQQVLAPSGKEMLEFLSGPALPRDKELYVRVGHGEALTMPDRHDFMRFVSGTDVRPLTRPAHVSATTFFLVRLTNLAGSNREARR
jgi:hypothetical protein